MLQDNVWKKHKMDNMVYAEYFAGPEPQFDMSKVNKKLKGQGKAEKGEGKKKGHTPKKGQPKLTPVTPMPGNV